MSFKKNIHSNEPLPGLCSPEDIWRRIHCYINCWGRKFMFWLTSSNWKELYVIWIPGCNIHTSYPYIIHTSEVYCVYIYIHIVTLFVNIYMYTHFICSLCIRTWRSNALLRPIGSPLGLSYRSQSFTADGERRTWIEHKQTSPEIGPLKAMDIYRFLLMVPEIHICRQVTLWCKFESFHCRGYSPCFFNISTTVVMF